MLVFFYEALLAGTSAVFFTQNAHLVHILTQAGWCCLTSTHLKENGEVTSNKQLVKASRFLMGIIEPELTQHLGSPGDQRPQRYQADTGPSSTLPVLGN